MNLEDGKRLVKLARSSIFSEPKLPEGFEKEQGVFVTLSSYPSGSLRGCIGFPEPVMPLKEAVVEAAWAAAFDDPRFTPLTKEEKFTVEVSVLTVPEQIKGSEEELIKKVRVGEDGIIIEQGFAKLCKKSGDQEAPVIFLKHNVSILSLWLFNISENC